MISKPKNTDNYFNLGWLHNKKGLTDKALEYYNKVIELNPDDKAFVNIAYIYEEMGHQDKAIEYFDKAIDLYKKILNINTQNIVCYYNLGCLHEKKVQYGRAIEYFEKCIAIKAKYLDASTKLEELYKKIRGLPRRHILK